MLAKRIIPCLDVTGGRVVKGVNFVELRDAGDPVEIAARYNEQGADELTFLDITATSDGRDLILHIIEAVASQVFIPLTVGGGVRTVQDVRRLLNAGADKVSFNSAAVAEPAGDPRRVGEVRRAVHRRRDRRQAAHAGEAAPRRPAGTSTPTAAARTPASTRSQWARRMAGCGAGEILLTSMDRDGTRSGFDLALTRAVSDAVDVPVIASGGVGALEHLAEGIRVGGADAVLAASIFHYGEFTVRQAKALLARAASRCARDPARRSLKRCAPTRRARRRRTRCASSAASGSAASCRCRRAGPAADARPGARNPLQLARPGPRPAGAASMPSPAPARSASRRRRAAPPRWSLLERDRAAGAQPARERAAPAGDDACASSAPMRSPGWRARRRRASTSCFLDPPFDSAPRRAGAGRGGAAGRRRTGWIYLEAPRPLDGASRRAAGLRLTRQGRAGAVHSHLLQRGARRRRLHPARGYTAGRTATVASGGERLDLRDPTDRRLSRHLRPDDARPRRPDAPREPAVRAPDRRGRRRAPQAHHVHDRRADRDRARSWRPSIRRSR